MSVTVFIKHPVCYSVYEAPMNVSNVLKVTVEPGMKKNSQNALCPKRKLE